MVLIQTLFNYSWQAAVYAFLVWLVYYFFKSSTRTAKFSVLALGILIVAIGSSTDLLQEQFEEIDAASEQHIRHIKSVQNTYEA